MLRAPLLALLLLSACAGLDREAGARLEVAPAIERDRRVTVRAGRPVQYRVTGGGKVDAALLTAHRAGREVWQAPLVRRGDAWVASAVLQAPGAHVLTARLYSGRTVATGAVDVWALGAGEPAPAGTVSQPLELVRTSGRPGGDANGWWGILAVAVLFAGVLAGSFGWWRRRRAA